MSRPDRKKNFQKVSASGSPRGQHPPAACRRVRHEDPLIVSLMHIDY